MYINTATIIAILIALTTSMAVIVMSFAAHRKLLNKYNLLKISYNNVRQNCVLHHVRKPF